MCQQSFVFNDIFRKFNKKIKPEDNNLAFSFFARVGCLPESTGMLSVQERMLMKAARG